MIPDYRVCVRQISASLPRAYTQYAGGRGTGLRKGSDFFAQHFGVCRRAHAQVRAHRSRGAFNSAKCPRPALLGASASAFVFILILPCGKEVVIKRGPLRMGDGLSGARGGRARRSPHLYPGKPRAGPALLCLGCAQHSALMAVCLRCRKRSPAGHVRLIRPAASQSTLPPSDEAGRRRRRRRLLSPPSRHSLQPGARRSWSRTSRLPSAANGLATRSAGLNSGAPLSPSWN